MNPGKNPGTIHEVGNGMNRISSSAKISPLADIEESTKGTKITIEDFVTIDSFVKIKCVGGTGDVLIGESCYINSGKQVALNPIDEDINGIHFYKVSRLTRLETFPPYFSYRFP